MDHQIKIWGEHQALAKPSTENALVWARTVAYKPEVVSVYNQAADLGDMSKRFEEVLGTLWVQEFGTLDMSVMEDLRIVSEILAREHLSRDRSKVLLTDPTTGSAIAEIPVEAFTLTGNGLKLTPEAHTALALTFQEVGREERALARYQDSSPARKLVTNAGRQSAIEGVQDKVLMLLKRAPFLSSFASFEASDTQEEIQVELRFYLYDLLALNKQYDPRPQIAPILADKLGSEIAKSLLTAAIAAESPQPHNTYPVLIGIGPYRGDLSYSLWIPMATDLEARFFSSPAVTIDPDSITVSQKMDYRESVWTVYLSARCSVGLPPNRDFTVHRCEDEFIPAEVVEN